jgi:sulfur relay (sulfurtransferase) complex TusBCD TusD component (DsrE family)
LPPSICIRLAGYTNAVKANRPTAVLAGGIRHRLRSRPEACEFLLGRNATARPATAVAQEVVVHLSRFNAEQHAALMAIRSATAMAQQGAKVTLLLDVDGVRLADARQASSPSQHGPGDNVVQALEQFVKAGGTALVCPHCAAAAGIGAANLRPGARIGAEGEVATVVLRASKVIDH